ncbi:MAG TPA: hypothetical protein VGO96_02805 [Pyrinomonadaceae bacterium]|nr:hypothetical protein [Pyrinomonadaceae bacterium]
MKVVLALIIASGGVWFGLTLKYEVSSPSGWPQDVKLHRNAASGIITATEAGTGKMLFSYMGDEGIRPVSFERTDARHWTVKFEEVKP